MAHRYRRDLIGHFVRKEQRTQQPCHHACCRGYRVHPDNYPVILPNRTLRRATDEDLEAHYRKVSREETPKARAAELQILAEMERRDHADEVRREREHIKAARRDAKESNRAAQRMEREAEKERITLAAEDATRGYLVTPQGRARGISDEELLTGRQSLFDRYATDEAKDFFRSNPRPTAAYLNRGVDSRYVERATEPRRNRGPRRTRAMGWGEPRHPSRPSRKTRALGWGDAA